MDPITTSFLIGFGSVLAWDALRRFADSRSNRTLERRIAALEAVDHAATSLRMQDLEHSQQGLKNALETIKNRTQTRWGG